VSRLVHLKVSRLFKMSGLVHVYVINHMVLKQAGLQPEQAGPHHGERVGQGEQAGPERKTETGSSRK
jgi:hypothetical protein